VCIGLVLMANQCRIEARLSMDQTTMTHLARRLGNQPPYSRDLSPLHLTLPVERALYSLDQSTLAHLEAGDVLLLPPDDTATLTVGHHRLEGNLHDHTLTLENIMQPHTETPQETPTTLEDLTISLSVHAGTCTLTIPQLQSLRPGVVLTLQELRDGLTISAGGTPIGRGALVKIGEHQGIRLLEVHGHDNA